MASLAVEVADVSKRFTLADEKVSSLKERVLKAGRHKTHDFWALRDVSFDVAEGETVGILGRNGSGKSTLLKCISGILTPTSGEIRVRGSLAALLELGAGFQPELSGRENVFLNASLLGLSRREVEARFDEIVAFAELESFIDQQVKFYSSGMYVRLGFAVAVNVDPDVLVIDEVLAVGDERFQRKCLNRVKDFQVEGRTILFVTHAVDLVRQVCDRAVVIDDGRVIGDAPSSEAIRIFRDHLRSIGEAPPDTEEDEEGIRRLLLKPIRFVDGQVSHRGDEERDYLVPNDPMTVSLTFEVLETLDHVVFWIIIVSPSGETLFGVDSDNLGYRFDARPGTGTVTFDFEQVPFLDGTYTAACGIRSGDGMVVYDERDVQFQVANPGPMIGAVSLPIRMEVDLQATP